MSLYMKRNLLIILLIGLFTKPVLLSAKSGLVELNVVWEVNDSIVTYTKDQTFLDNLKKIRLDFDASSTMAFATVFNNSDIVFQIDWNSYSYEFNGNGLVSLMPEKDAYSSKEPLQTVYKNGHAIRSFLPLYGDGVDERAIKKAYKKTKKPVSIQLTYNCRIIYNDETIYLKVISIGEYRGG